MQRRAFTLVEVMLVIVLLGLIIYFAFPDLGAELKRRSLVESADRLRSLIVMTRARAMQDGCRFRIEMPGTPDPLDPNAVRELDVPLETQQPVLKQQVDRLNNPEFFGDIELPWDSILQQGTRCVSVLRWSPGETHCDISFNKPIADPSIPEEHATFEPLTLNPDGTCDGAVFILTDLPPDAELTSDDVGRILKVFVDGRTGEAWIQRAWRTEECEMMLEEGAQPILRMDFTRPDLITEENVLEIRVGAGS